MRAGLLTALYNTRDPYNIGGVLSRLVMDFSGNKYRYEGAWVPGAASIPGWTFSRPGYNAIRNSTPTVGSAAGTPGTLPTNWSAQNFSGGARQVVGTGTDTVTGLPYVDIRFFGTATSAAGFIIFFDTVTGISASNGQTLTTSVYVGLVGGSLAGFTNPLLAYDQANSGGTYLSTKFGTNISPTSTLLRYSFSAATDQPTVAFVRPFLIVPGVTNGAAIDVTLRIAAPQLEPGSIAGPYQATTGSAVTSGVNTTYAETVNGTLTAFGPNQPRITDRGLLVEEARTNLLLQSNDLSSATWTKANTTATLVAGAPDGGLASRLSATAAFATAFQGLVSVSASTTYAVSAYVKNVNASDVSIVLEAADHGGSSATISYNFANKTISGANSGFSIVSRTALEIGGGWARLTIVLTTPAGLTTLRPKPWIGPYSGTNYSGQAIDWWGIQTELGSFPTSPIVTTTAAATRAADNASVTGLSAMLGQFRTNLLTWSQAFDNALWGKARVTVTADAIVAPDGTTTADKLEETASSGSHVLAQNPASVFTSSTYSIYAKKGERDWLWIYFASYGAGSAWFDLNTGTIGTVESGIAATITDVGNGWYRCSIRQVTGSTAVGVGIAVTTGNAATSYLGVAGNGIYIWGAQLETGTTATAYIPTTTAAASAGDPVTVVGYGEYLSATQSNDAAIVSINDGTFANMVSVRRGSNASTFGANSRYGDVWNTDPPQVGGKTGARILKGAARLRARQLSNAADGSYLGATSIAGTPALSTVTFGNTNPAGSPWLNGYIQRVVIGGDAPDTALARATI